MNTAPGINSHKGSHHATGDITVQPHMPAAAGTHRLVDERATLNPSFWPEKHSFLLLTGITCLACLLRFALLGEKALWIDEIWSIGISRMPWHSFLWTVRNQDPNMSLYYALLHVWTRLGESESVVRALSALTGIATIPALFVLGTRLFGRPIGLVASTLLALNAFHIQWSQEARAYSLAVLLVTLSSFYFTKSVERPSPRNLALYVLTSSLALYAHIYALLVLVAQWVSLLFLKRREVSWKDLFSSAAMVGLLTLPLGLLIYERAQHPWLPLGWLPKPSLHGVYDVLYALAGNADFAGSHGGKAILVAYVLVCLAAFVAWVRAWQSHGRSFDSWRWAFLLCWLFVPVALALAISLVQPMFMSRYLLMCIPPLVLLAAQGIVSLKPAPISVLALIIVVGLATQRLPQYYQHRHTYQEWRLVTNYVINQSRAGDGTIFCIAPGRLLFDYYRDRYHVGFPGYLGLVYPEPGDERRDPKVLDYLPPMSSSLLDSAATRHPRIWLVVYHDTFAATEEARDRIEASLTAQYRDVQKTKFGGVTVLLYSNGGS
jgi:mannosyltransferase